MRFSVRQEDLDLASGVVSTLINRSSTSLPVLSNALVIGEPGFITFLGTDIESLVTVRIPAEVEQPGRLTLPAEKLSELVRLLPPGTSVSLEEDAGRVHITCETNNYRLMTLPADDFPEWPREPSTTRFQLPQKQLKTLIDSISYAIPPKETRKVLLGAYTQIEEMTLRMTGTDGRKLGRMSVPINSLDGDGTATQIIPGKFLSDVRKHLRDEGLADLEFSPRQVRVRIENVEFCCNAIPGRYPDTNAVIPREFPFQVRFNRDALLSAARRAGVVSEDRNKSIILKFADNTCHFSSAAADVGTFSGRLGLEYTGSPLEIALNFEFLVQTIMGYKDPDLRLFLKSSSSPVVFRCDKEPEHFCVLMPVKLVDARPPSSEPEEPEAN